MKLVLSLLENFITLKPGTTPQDIEKALIQLGHEVEGIAKSGGSFANVLIGHIKERIQHPNADRLGVCQVDVGEGKLRQIVCGAPNACAGLTVAVAMPGAVLPGDFAIKVSKIRDVESNGMICSLDELAMASERASGIWEMDTQAKPGTPLDDVLGPSETVMEVAVTPNRGDCFSHLGLARDLAALGLGKLKPVKAPAASKTSTKVKAETTTAGCPQINLVEITNLKNTPSPSHIQKQLEAAGLRPKNALVDATNYVMIALGQPLHAYDATKLKGTVRAVNAKGGESFKGIGDVTLKLVKDDVTIQDDSGIVGLGGILGGDGTSVSDTTTSVVLEAAYFNPVRIALTGQAHQLHTDARQRFERSVDPAMTQTALLYCASLIKQWAGGTVSSMATAGKGPEAPHAIAYNPEFFEIYIGHKLTAPQQKTILQNLGFKVAGSAKAWKVTPPTYRTYMTTPEDLTEELLRIVGYENVTPKLPPAMAGQFQVNGAPIILDRTARKALAASGFLEVITYSFIGRDTAQKFAPASDLIELANPLAQTDMTTMRPSLLPGLLTALKGNLAKSEPTARLAEVGKVYTAKAESLSAAGVLTASSTRHWRVKVAEPDAFAAKAAALQALTLLGAPVESTTTLGFHNNRNVPDYFHPGRSGSIQVGPFVLAVFGEIHPAILKSFGLTINVAAFELNLEALLKLTSKPRPWQPLPYPPVLRDLAFLLPKEVNASSVIAAVRASNRDLLKSVEVFDHYVGERIAAGKQSIAISLTLQSAERTLTDADIKPVIDAAVNAVKDQLQGELRA